MRETYKINPKCIYCGGTSGGGATAYDMVCAVPETFKGIVSAVRSRALSLFPPDFICNETRAVKWCMISGSKDYNYNHCVEQEKAWLATRKFKNVRLFDIPNMGHKTPDGPSLELAFDWLDNGDTPA